MRDGLLCFDSELENGRSFFTPADRGFLSGMVESALQFDYAKFLTVLAMGYWETAATDL